MKTMTVTTVELGEKGVAIWLHTASDPIPEEWALGVELTVAMKKKHGISKLRSLVVTDGGAPNVAQRRELHEDVFERRPSKLAVISNSFTNPVKRGIATAIGWVNPAFKAVMPDRWRDALVHADLEGEIVPILDVLRQLQRDLPPVKTLVELERHVGRIEKR
jgi:hypothetical protein